MEGDGARRCSILVVDDDAEIAELVAKALEKDHRVRVAGGVPDALLAVEAEVPDLILTDLHMPGQNGDELLMFVAERHPAVLRMIFSGSALERRRLLDEGVAQAEVAKPIGLVALRSTVTQVIARMLQTEKCASLGVDGECRAR